jgi:hypothetical protein
MATRRILRLLGLTALALPLGGHGQSSEVGPDGQELLAPVGPSGLVRFLSESTHGALHVGLIYGRPQFSAEATDAWNIIGKGDLQLMLFGIPVVSSYEFGSFASTRGAQNRLRVSVDTEKLKEIIQLRDARRLEQARWRHDSLQIALATGEHSVVVDSAAFPARLPQQEVQASSSEAIGLDTDSLRSTTDRSTGELSRPRQESLAVDTGLAVPAIPDANAVLLSAAESAKDRAEAMVAMDMERAMGGRFLMGLRRMELGTLTPNGSEFLLNGLSLQGVGVEWASERFFFAFDHGNCLDDVWRSATISADRLRRLQESLFLLDAPELDPRKLTVLRTGVGLPESSHVHIGLLRGRRSGLFYGSESPSSGERNEMTNHVVEVDAAMVIKADHMVRLVVARSMTSVEVGEPGLEGDDALEGGGATQYSAGILQWRTELPKTRTTFNLTGRAVGSAFHSMGLAFLRSGARSLDGAISKDLGRLRLRLGYKRELRQGASGKDQLRLDRIRLQTTYRVSKAVSLRASMLPMFVAGRQPSTIDQRVLVTQAGINVRWRKGKTQYTMLGECSRFHQLMFLGSVLSSTTWFGNVGAEVQGGRGRTALTYAGFLEPGTTHPSAGSLSWEVSYKLRNGIELGTGTVIDPSALGNVGGSFRYRQPLYKGLHLTLSAERWQERQIYQSQDFGLEDLGSYTCSVLVGYSW